MSIDVSKMPKLGFGLMRLPENDGVIDLDHVCRMVDMYMESGMNYFDTAYVYHSGKSECVVKDALCKRYDRDKFMLATKLPAWEIKCSEDRDRIFNVQLERTGAGYFDLYLLHSIEDGSNYETYEKYDCFRWGMKKKEEGLIKHLGFSFHGSPALLKEVLDKHPEIEFVQIQLNYADWNNPIVRSGELYNILAERKIPIIVMEPIKGGTLANPADKIKDALKENIPDSTPAEAALRFVGSLDGVMTILSGMSSEDQMRENIATFTNFKKLTDSEQEGIDKAVAIMRDIALIGCTSCRYCCDGCPSSIPIPDIFRALNTVKLYNEEFRPQMFYNGVTQGKGKASDCIGCGQCEGVCPQHLNIIELMESAKEQFDSGKFSR